MIRVIKQKLQLEFREEVYANGDQCFFSGKYLAVGKEKQAICGTIDNEMRSIINLFFLYLDERDKRKKWADEHHNFDNYKTDYKYIIKDSKTYNCKADKELKS